MNAEVAVNSHLYWSEVQCTDGTSYPEDLRPRLFSVVVPAWMAIRAEVCRVVGRDTPITVTSFYRTMKYNKAIGGVTNSRHIHGDAWDSTATPGLPVLAYAVLVARLARQRPELLIRGVGLYLEDGIVHTDCQPEANVVLWRAIYTPDPKRPSKMKRVYLPWTGNGAE